MNTISRRNLVLSSVATLALGSNRVFAQFESLEGETVAVSDSTGAEIDLGDTGFVFSSRYGDDTYDGEAILFGNDTASVAIKFVPKGNDTEDVAQLEHSKLVDFYPQAEEAGSAILEDGMWVAFSIVNKNSTERSVYIEFQVGAFPDHDLMVDFTSDTDAFESDFELLQQVSLAGMAPCLFTEDSQIQTLTFPEIAAAGSSSRRTTRSTRTSTQVGDPTETPIARGSSTAGDNDFVEGVRAHRTDFMASFSEFATALAVFGDDASTEADQSDALGTLATVAEGWISYPDDASALTAPAEFADLEDLYLDWADEIGLLGQLFTDAFNGVGDLDPAFDQIGVVDAIDQELKSAIDSEGAGMPSFHSRSAAIKHLSQVI